eukprot:366130-Chlamydomonas_euryale.AAC.1
MLRVESVHSNACCGSRVALCVCATHNVPAFAALWLCACVVKPTSSALPASSPSGVGSRSRSACVHALRLELRGDGFAAHHRLLEALHVVRHLHQLLAQLRDERVALQQQLLKFLDLLLAARHSLAALLALQQRRQRRRRRCRARSLRDQADELALQGLCLGNELGVLRPQVPVEALRLVMHCARDAQRLLVCRLCTRKLCPCRSRCAVTASHASAA